MQPIFQAGRRSIQPEILDGLEPQAAQASLQDLIRINRYLGGHEASRKAFATVAPKGPFTVLDVGAASGDTGAALKQRFRQAHVTSLDYKLSHLHQAAPPKVAGDAFKLPFAPRSFDFVHCSLFLHHFPDASVVQLLQGFRTVARKAVIVNDLERHRLAYYFLPATRWLLRWDPVTVHDGPISVQAAFRQQELQRLAETAGLRDVKTQVYRPAFRITMVGKV